MQQVVERPEVEALSFDLWSTLIKSHPEFKPARTALLLSSFGMDPARSAEADLCLREADRAADLEAERTGADVGFAERVLTMHQGALARSLADSAAPDAAELTRLEREQEAICARFAPLPYSPLVPGLLLRLGALVPVAVTSNTGMLGGATMRGALAANGLLPAFRVLVFSNEVGAAKPSERIFSATLGALASLHGAPLPPARVLHVGDNAVADIEGAQRAGMAHQLVNVAGAPPIEDVLSSLVESLRPAAADARPA